MHGLQKIAIGGLISLLLPAAALAQAAAPAAPAAAAPAAAAAAAPAAPAIATMAVSSTSFEDGGILPLKYATAGATKENPLSVAPQLSWSGEPATTKSFVLLSHDMNADPFPTILRFHWAVLNIPASTHSLAEGTPNVATLPDGSIQLINAHNTVGWASPSAGGTIYHYYPFEIFALDTKLSLGPDAKPDDVANAMKGHIVGHGLEVVRYHAPPAAPAAAPAPAGK